MSERATIGLDVGSTYVKALAVTTDGLEVHEVRWSTPWRAGADGTAELDANDLVAITARLLSELVATCTDLEIVGVGVSGMAEAGVLVGADEVRHPIIAWFDPRGGREIAATPDEFRAVFPEHTGLPVGPLATISKLLHLRSGGVTITGAQWLNVPEFVAYALGGDRAAEISLLSRTGLIDQGPGEPWPWSFEILGTTPALLPPIRAAGEPWGTVGAATTTTGMPLPATVVGAVLTVAGHDHLVASVAGGVLRSDQLYDSLGTAEALVRPLDTPLEPAERAYLAVNGVNAVRHALPGKSVMLAGARSGLLLRRVLQLLGVNDAAGRDELDRRVMKLPSSGRSGLTVTGADNADGVLSVRADTDGLSPELLFAATLDHSTDAVLELVELMGHAVPPAEHTVVAGGWARMECVRQSRRRALPGVTVSERSEDTAFGAAMFGAYAASDRAQAFEAFAHSYAASPAGHDRTGLV